MVVDERAIIVQLRWVLWSKRARSRSTRYLQISRWLFGQNTDLFFWINKVSAWCFFFKFWAGFSLRCAGLHAAWFLSLVSFHTETHRYTPLLLRIKIIIVKFLLKITSLKIQSDCFGIKRSQKRPTDCGLHQALHIYYDTWRWNVIKDSKFQPSLVDKKVFKIWVLLGTSWPVQYSGLYFAGVRSTFVRFQHIFQKISNIHDLVVGHWTLCDGKTNWNRENKCF